MDARPRAVFDEQPYFSRSRAASPPPLPRNVAHMQLIAHFAAGANWFAMTSTRKVRVWPVENSTVRASPSDDSAMAACPANVWGRQYSRSIGDFLVACNRRMRAPPAANAGSIGRDSATTSRASRQQRNRLAVLERISAACGWRCRRRRAPGDCRHFRGWRAVYSAGSSYVLFPNTSLSELQELPVSMHV